VSEHNKIRYIRHAHKYGEVFKKIGTAIRVHSNEIGKLKVKLGVFFEPEKGRSHIGNLVFPVPKSISNRTGHEPQLE